MASITQRIPNLLGGQSQQPDSLKQPGQTSQCINFIPDVTYGLKRRPGLQYKGGLTGATSNGLWFHIVESSSARYFGHFDASGNLFIWNADTGAAETVNASTAEAKAYVAGIANADFDVLQVNDYNFVLNRSKVVGKLATKSALRNPEAFVRVNGVGYDTTYNVYLNGTKYSYTTPTSGTISISGTLTGIIGALPAGWTGTAVGSGFTLRRTGNADFTIDADGGISGSAIDAYKGSVPNVASLPVQCENGFVFKVANLASEIADDYYVKFKVDGSQSYGSGIWEETVQPDIETYLDPDTMPHVIVHESNGTWTYRSLNEAAKLDEDLYWVERRVGDVETNPWPSFLDNKISGISFFKNRLILLSGGNVLASQPGGYFNFFRSSALVSTDADSIDLACGSLRPVELKHAIADSGGLILFSENSQFVLTVAAGADAFSAKSAEVKRFSTFTTNPNIEPLDTGESILFCDYNQSFSSVTEMVVSGPSRDPEIANLSKTNPNLLPSNLLQVAASPTASTVAFVDGATPSKVYIFKYYNTGGSRVLASWLSWEFPGDVEHIFFDHNSMFVALKYNGGWSSNLIPLDADISGTAIGSLGAPWTYRVDLSTTPNMVYDSGTNETVCTFPYGYGVGNPIVIVDEPLDLGRVFYFDPSDVVTDSVRVPGDVTGAQRVTIGLQYESRLVLPKFYVKSSPQPGTVKSDTVNIPRVTRMEIESTDSGPYYVDIESLGRTKKTIELSNVITNKYDLNTPPVPDIQLNSFPVMSKGTDVTLTIRSSTPFPLSFVAATWYAIYSKRGIRSL